MPEDKKQKWSEIFVNWQTFVWAISILSTLIMVAIGASMSAKADVGTVNAKLETQINDTQWIKEALTEIKSDIKNIK